MVNNQMKWYGIRGLVRFDKSFFEERIVIVYAKDMNEAFLKAEKEFRGYSEILDGEFIAFQQAYQISENLYSIAVYDDGYPSDIAEVFSLFRVSSLGVDKYINRFFDTGKELERKPNPRRRIWLRSSDEALAENSAAHRLCRNQNKPQRRL